MDGPRRDQAFAVATQSVTGGDGRRKGPRRLGIAIVLVAAAVLIAVGFVGPRLSGLPNFDIGYFATPTPRVPPSPGPTPTPTRPGETPLVTPLPSLSRPDGVAALGGSLVVAGDALQRLDLKTATMTRLEPVTLWQDAIVMAADGRVTCACIVDSANQAGPTRTVRIVRIDGGTTVTSDLVMFQASSSATRDQLDPTIDVVMDRDGRGGLLATAARTATDWRVSLRSFDARAVVTGPEVPIGRVALPPSPVASPSPSPVDGSGSEQVYLDGPHIRWSPDGRTAFVWATAQHYSDYAEPTSTRGAWRIRLDPNGGVEDVAVATGLLDVPDYCGGVFASPDRFAAFCAEPVPDQPSAHWTVRVLDSDGHAVDAIQVPDPGQYGYAEALVDQASGRLYAWNPIGLSLVRVDVTTASMTSATFEPFQSPAGGITPSRPDRAPAWQDTDSSIQQSLFEPLTGSSDGSRLFAVGFQPEEGSDIYRQKALGVFVIDPVSLVLVQHWAPVANDTWAAEIPGGRVVVGAVPGMNADGDQVPWSGSLTIRSAADGAILARYGQVSTDMPPVLIRP